MKRILLYNTIRRPQRFLADLMRLLRSKGYRIVEVSADPAAAPDRRPWLSSEPAVILALLPFWYLLYAAWLLGKTWGTRPDALVCCGWSEKVVLSPLARLLGWRVIWLEYPDQSRNLFTGWKGRLYGRASKKVEVIAFSRETEETIRPLVGEEVRLHILLPAALEDRASYQEDMFRRLVDRPRHRFVIGSILETLDKTLTERLLSALSIAVTVCPAIELVVIGDGENRKQLQWLIRKMNLDRHVWLVGASDVPTKWLEHVNVYVVANEQPSLEEMAGAIAAMARSVPVLAHRQAGLSDIVTSKTGALIDITDSETLARQFLKLQQDEDLRRQLGREARSIAEPLTLAQTAESIIRII